MTRKSKVEIIKETSRYYNLTNRSLDKYNDCVYRTEDGKMCAVGRCLRDDFQIENAEYGVEALFMDNFHDDNIFFKEEYRGHDVKFWADLQYFHDKGDHFTNKGLSKIGKKFKNKLIDIYKK